MKSYKLIILKIILGLFFCNKYISQKSKSQELNFFQSKNKLEIDQYGNFYLINKDDLITFSVTPKTEELSIDNFSCNNTFLKILKILGL